MKTTDFLIYKDVIIDYLRKLVRSLQVNSAAIERQMTTTQDSQRQELFERIVSYELWIMK